MKVRRSRYKRIQLYRTYLQVVSEPNHIKLKKLVSGQIVICRANFSAPHPVKCLPVRLWQFQPVTQKIQNLHMFRWDCCTERLKTSYLSNQLNMLEVSLFEI